MRPVLWISPGKNGEKVRTIDEALKERTIIVVENPKPVIETPKNVVEAPKKEDKPIESVTSQQPKTEAKSSSEPAKTLFAQKSETTNTKNNATDSIGWFWCENLKCADPISIDRNKTLNTEMCPLCHTHTLHEAKINTRADAANERLRFLQSKEKQVTKPVETKQPMTREETLKAIARNRNTKKIMTDKFLELVKPIGVVSARALDWSDETAAKILEIMNNYQGA